MGLFDSILGGGGDSGGGVQQVERLTPAQKSLLNALTGFITPQIGQPGRIPGAELAPAGPGALQQQAFGFGAGLPGLLGGQAFQPFDPQSTISAFQPVAEAARRGFQQETIPAIAGAAGFGGGARSSGFQNILARGGRDLELGLAGQLGSQLFGAEQASLGRQAQIPGIGLNIASQLANLGRVQQGFPAQQREFQLQQFLAADPSRNPALGLLGPALGTSGFDTAVFQGQQTPGLLQALAPALGSFAGTEKGSQQIGGLLGGLGGLLGGIF